MKLAIFGATGGTGRALVRLALEEGHGVTAAARNPADLDATHAGLRVCRADVLEPASLPAVLAEADAVVSALGAASGREPTTLYSAGVENVLVAMARTGVHRFVGISAAPVIPKDERVGFERFAFPIVHRFFGGTYADLRRMEAVLAASEAEWTVLRPPRLTDRPATGSYRMAAGHNVPGGRKITRGDLARAMLDALTDPAAVRTALGVSN